jgi:hypothetical protein
MRDCPPALIRIHHRRAADFGNESAAAGTKCDDADYKPEKRTHWRSPSVVNCVSIRQKVAFANADGIERTIRALWTIRSRNYCHRASVVDLNNVSIKGATREETVMFLIWLMQRASSG